MTSTLPTDSQHPRQDPGPATLGPPSVGNNALVKLFVAIPFAALVAAAPFAWGWGLSWLDAGLALFFYFLTVTGITVGYHRHFTHRAFRARRGLRVGLAVLGSMAFQGPVITWVADHRRHHAFADKEGDPHSPWLFGTTPAALIKGLCHAHFGWMLHAERTNPARYAPDLLADADVARVDRQFPFWTVVSLAAPALLGGVHHVTWSVNSLCHMFGERPWTERDRSTNFWPLAIASMGESWHNLHHADPTSARHGVGRGQLDASARLIAIFEGLGWAHDVRWPTAQRLARLTAARGRQR
jgi:stearoyl-CoA desaturase (delta-9 desaturase)